MANLKKQASENSREEGRSAVPHDSADGPRNPGVEKDSGGVRIARSGDEWVPNAEKPHPSRRLEMRSEGYGIAAGYERPYNRNKAEQKKDKDEQYGPIPHSGYYGAGESLRPFKVGQAGFDNELEWYRNQYGRETSGYSKKK